MRLKHLLVANPTAQSGKNAVRIHRARGILDRFGLVHDYLATEPEGRTVEAVRRALDAGVYGTVICMGGDGTFAEAAKGILASSCKAEVRLAMLPTGTANDQGKSFGLSSRDGALARNAEVIAEGRETRLDVGRLRRLTASGQPSEPELFFDSAGWGFGAVVLARRNEHRRQVARVPLLEAFWRDRLVYAGAVAGSLLDPAEGWRTFDARVEADGARVEWRGLVDLVVKGTPVYAGSWVLDREARTDDGKFEVIPFVGKTDLVSKAVLALDAAAQAAEILGMRPSAGLSARRVALELSGSPVPGQMDGEEAPAANRVEIEVLERALRLVVPAEHADGARPRRKR